jgi:uncharacterized membrane protein YkvI
MSPHAHAAVAAAGLLISALLGQLGIVDLIAKGYGTLAWGFLLVFVIPVLFVGTLRIVRMEAPEHGLLPRPFTKLNAGSRRRQPFQGGPH